MTTYRTKILSTGSAFPAKRMSNDDLAKLVETNDAWIHERTGIRARRIADVKGGETTSELALRASRQALERAGVAATEVDCILFATVSPDYVMPNTACVLQEKLGARRARGQRLHAIAGMVPHPLNRPKGCPFNTRCPEARAGICDTTDPATLELAPGHFAACHMRPVAMARPLQEARL